MKFLAHGDSVVSLRFKYVTGSPDSPNLTIDRNDRLPTTAERNTAITKLNEVSVLLDQYSTGQTDFGSDPEDFAGVGELIAYCRQYLQGDLDSTDLATLEQIEGKFGALAGEVPDYLENSDYLPPIEEILPRIGTTEELSSLIEGVKQVAEHAEAGADSILGREALMAEMAQASESGDLKRSTEIGLKEDAERTANNEQTPNRPAVAMASTVAELPAQLDAVIANLDEETASRFGASAVAGFEPSQFV